MTTKPNRESLAETISTNNHSQLGGEFFRYRRGQHLSPETQPREGSYSRTCRSIQGLQIVQSVARNPVVPSARRRILAEDACSPRHAAWPFPGRFHSIEGYTFFRIRLVASLLQKKSWWDFFAAVHHVHNFRKSSVFPHFVRGKGFLVRVRARRYGRLHPPFIPRTSPVFGGILEVFFGDRQIVPVGDSGCVPQPFTDQVRGVVLFQFGLPTGS